ncbi:hypothetical protein [Nonomuraea endophytica]|uniref:hypothetical protein n=1 Tax=Nonomuraea endophytica TaxID=714136 RepID=UPI0037CBD288
MSGQVTYFELPSTDIEATQQLFGWTFDDITAAVARVRELGGTAADPVSIPSGAYAHRSDEFSLSQQAGDRD